RPQLNGRAHGFIGILYLGHDGEPVVLEHLAQVAARRVVVIREHDGDRVPLAAGTSLVRLDMRSLSHSCTHCDPISKSGFLSARPSVPRKRSHYPKPPLS